MNLILFFNGWGMDKNVVEKMKIPKNFDLEVVNFPYKFEKERLNSYENIFFIGWSFGCYYLTKFIVENSIKSKNIIALNGNSQVIGENGISEKMFNFTLKTLTEESLIKFYQNMGIDEDFSKPKKDFNEIKNELIFLKENYIPMENIFTKVILGKDDKIIPFMKLKKYYEEKNISVIEKDYSHYPFDFFKSWTDIIGA